MYIKTWMLAGIAALGLTACGDTDLERGVTGAAAGAVAAEVTRGDPVIGATLGAAAGVLCDDIGIAGCR